MARLPGREHVVLDQPDDGHLAYTELCRSFAQIQFASFGTLAFTINRYSPLGSEVADPELGP